MTAARSNPQHAAAPAAATTGAGSGEAPRERHLTVVVKIGTSSITDTSGRINLDTIEKLCAEVAEVMSQGHRVVVVTSGAIAAGLPELGIDGDRYRTDMGTLQAVATVGQCALIGTYREVLAGHGLIAGQVLLVPLDFVIRSQYVHAGATLRRLLELGVVPVVNENDAVADDEIRWGDNDRIAALVANLVHADLLVLLTDTAGVHTDDPRRNAEASLITEMVDIDEQLRRAGDNPGTSRGSGGIASKLTAARVASRSGVSTLIAHAARPAVLADAVAGEPGIGTFVPAKATEMSARKLWIGFAVASEGEVEVDAGARQALQRGKSLLAVGVRAVHGGFDAGAPISVREVGGEVFAKGLARHGSSEVRAAAGKPRQDRPEGLPNVVIHANDLVLLAE